MGCLRRGLAKIRDSFLVAFDRLSIRRKLVGAFVAMALIPVSILGIYLALILLDLGDKNAERSIKDKLRIGSLMWESQKEKLMGAARTTAGDNFVILNRDLGLDQALSGYLQGIEARAGLILAMVVSNEGRILASTRPMNLAAQLEAELQSFLRDAGAIPSIQALWLSLSMEAGQTAVMVVAYPIFNYSHVQTGYVVVAAGLGESTQESLDASNSFSFFSNDKAQIGVPYFLALDGKVVYASDPDLAPILVEAKRRLGSLLPEGPVILSRGQARYLVASKVLEQPRDSAALSLVLAYPAQAYDEERFRSLILVALIIATSLGVALIIAFLLAANISKPMVAIAQGARAIVDGDYSIRLAVLSHDEIGEMAEEFNEMTQKLATTMEALAREVEEHLTAELQVRELNNVLETRVDERTKELSDTNHALAESLSLLRRTQKNLVETEKMAALGNLVGGIAHELNTPIGVSLTAISSVKERTSYLERLFSEGGMSKEKLSTYLSYVAEVEDIVLTNLERAVERIEFFKQISLDKDERNSSPINLYEYVDSFIESYQYQGLGSRYVIVNKVDPDASLVTSPGTLYQILVNLSNNAVYHGFEGRESGTITITGSMDDHELVLGFADDGNGIERDALPRIFEPFYSTKKSGDRSGLGLSIVYNLVASHFGGAITCQSQPGQGAHFLIHVPRVL